ncbi:MAG: LD-carboxypeptidase [Bacteroidia bacterium]|nr:LD-carboxypeptidase [Bacteroidia bacterium]
MKTPASLHPGDRIGIVAPARKILPVEIQAGIRKLESWGLEVVTGIHLYGSDNQYSGTDKERADDLQTMLDDSTIKAIISARGGYGTVRIIEMLDFTQVALNPKWIIGYSDMTVLHSHLSKNLGTESLHAVMPFKFPADGSDDNSVISLKKALFENNCEYQFNADLLNRKGEATAELTGGNLSILYSLRGTNFDIDTEGKILFIEDVDEYLYHIDRMIMNLKLGGKLKGLKGLLVGGMTDMKDNTVPFGKTAYEIIADAVKDYSFPLAFGFPAGHGDPNLALIMGRKTSLEVGKNHSMLMQNNS